jgi:hypothetical protein
MIGAKKIRIPAAERPFYDAITRMFPEREYIVMPQVAFAVSGEGVRIADLLVASRWQSRDSLLRGFEIKTTRASYKHELKEPEKGDIPARYCDLWTILAPAGLLSRSYVPENWGLWELADGQFSTRYAAKPLTPKDLPRSVMVSILQAAFHKIDAKLADEDIVQAHKEGVSEGRRKGREGMAAMTQAFADRLQEKQNEIDEIKGFLIDIGLPADSRCDKQSRAFARVNMIMRVFRTHWGSHIPEESLIKAIRYIATRGIQNFRPGLEHARATFARLLEDVNEQMQMFDPIDPAKEVLSSSEGDPVAPSALPKLQSQMEDPSPQNAR